MSKQAVAKLNELLIKKGITPDYQLIDSDTGTHINKFSYRVTCRISRNGPICTAKGSGLSKKEAKREAAIAFMLKYNIDDGDNNSSVVPSVNKRSTSPCAVNVTDTNRHAVLQTLCMRYNLEKPKYEDIDATGPPHARYFTIQCRVSDLCTKGQGTTKAEGKLNATTKMIQVLMEEAEVYEIFESPRLTMTADSNEIVCLSENLRGPQLPVPIGIFGRRRSSNASSDSCSTVDSPSVVDRLFNNRTKVKKNIVEGSNDSASNMNLIDFDEDYGTKSGFSKSKSKSASNLFELVNGETQDSDFNCSFKKLPLLQAVDKIEATFVSVEKQLYGEILDTLVRRDLPRQKTVTILYHEFEVFINAGSRPKILEGSSECTDPSIRIASLSKLLMELKDHVDINRKRLNARRK